MSPSPVTPLVYHGVDDRPRGGDPRSLFVSRKRFAAQMAFLARRREVVALADCVAAIGEARRPRVAITFDDGLRSVLENAVPVLRRHGFPATIFVSTGWLSGRHGHDPTADVLTAAEVRDLAQMGFEIGSHTHTHLDCSAATTEAIHDDLERSVESLTALLGARPRYLAWPYGRSSEAARDAAARVGFDCAFGADHPHSSRYAVPRVPISPPDGQMMFALKSGGRYVALRRSTATTAASAILRPLWRGRGRVVR